MARIFVVVLFLAECQDDSGLYSNPLDPFGVDLDTGRTGLLSASAGDGDIHHVADAGRILVHAGSRAENAMALRSA